MSAQPPAAAAQHDAAQFLLQPPGYRRNILDVFPSSTSLSSPATAAHSLSTWIVMDWCDRGPLSGIASRMAGEPLEQKLVGCWLAWGRVWLGLAGPNRLLPAGSCRSASQR